MSKTVFNLHPRVRAFIEWRLEHYREDKRTLSEYRADMMPSNTPRYTAEPGAPGSGRPTEELAAKLAANPYILDLERGINAIEHVLTRLTPERQRLIELVYFKGSYTVEGAAQVLHVSRRTAYRHINEVLTAIAAELGYTAL